MVKRLAVTIRWILLVLEMMLRMTMRMHFPGSMRITIWDPIFRVPMVVILSKRRSRSTLVVVVVMMHLGVHGIRMNSVMHGRLATVVHVLVLWALVLVLMAWESLVHSMRTRMVAMVFLSSHVVILSNVRDWWRLSWMLLLLRSRLMLLLRLVRPTI